MITDVDTPGLLSYAHRLQAGNTTATELTRQTLRRITASQDTLNAFRHVRADDAMRDAAAADEQLAVGGSAPLLGVPIAIKDDTDIAGLPTAFGCSGNFPPATRDAEVVRRFRAAGAVIVGKTNTPEVGQWPFTEGTAFGATRNPWAPEYTPGGSSGGSAAAVAAGLVPAALGSDGAGSVRIPAAWNHLVGIKTQLGRIPSAPEPEPFHGLTVHGPLARTVADAAMLLDTAAGTGSRFRDAAHREPGTLRIGLSLRMPYTTINAELDGEVRRAVLRLAERFGALGHEIVEIDPPYGLIGLNFLPRSMSGIRDWCSRVPDMTRLDPRTQANIRTASRLPRGLLKLARAAEPRLRGRIGSVFGEVDTVLAPTTATPPPPIGTFDGLTGWQTDQRMIAACPYAWPWNVLGWPALNIPAGLTTEGLPMGAQLLGLAHSEERLISAAAQLESAERWHERAPPL